MFRLLILSDILLYLLSVSTFSQSNELSAEKEIINKKIVELKEYYDSLFRNRLQVVDGRAHTAKYPTGMGHPFFLTREPVPGTIYMNGRVFKYSFIRYDILNDLLQIYHFTNSGPQIIDLNKNKIEAFDIDIHHFKNYSGLKTHGIFSPNGFYEEKYSGQLSYLVRWEKTYRSNISGSTGEFEEHTYRYILTPDGLFRIKNRKSLLNVFPGNEEEINGYIRKSQITIKLAEDEDIINIIKFYESITK